jgi:protein farnesyltransferase subunit beta
MHHNGEIDMRAIYCALVIADILNLIEGNEQLTSGMSDFIASCQTYEGGITCIPFGEAHGGYTFCALGAMIILGQEDKLDLNRLAEWLCNR